jgi:molecular chaperone GrpE
LTEDVIEQAENSTDQAEDGTTEVVADETGAEKTSEGASGADEVRSAEPESEFQQQFKRLAADFENFRRRQVIEKEQLLQFAGERILERLIGVMDNFDRALASAETATDIQVVLKGIQMIHRQMEDLLSKEGVKQMACKGEPFDPNQHEAVMQVEMDDVADQTIVDVFRAGYTLNGRVLRHAMVRVASNPSGVIANQTTNAGAEAATADSASE